MVWGGKFVFIPWRPEDGCLSKDVSIICLLSVENYTYKLRISLMRSSKPRERQHTLLKPEHESTKDLSRLQPSYDINILKTTTCLSIENIFKMYMMIGWAVTLII